MTEEEKKNFLEISKRIGYKVGTYCNDEEIEVFEKILKDYKYKNNLIQKQQEEIEMYKDIKRIAETQVTELADFISYKGKLEKKDKTIDLMAEEICFKEPLKYTTAQEVKQYFAKKAEEN